MPAQVVSIPIDEVEPHPKLTLRFLYDVESLAALMKSAADENAPNGQLEPGRVVPRKDRKKGYLAYIGVRRYLALKLLYGKAHDLRFATYNAYVDTGLSELQMFVRAKMENEEERGERQGLSLLEQVFGLYKIRDSVSAEKLDGDLRREFMVAGRLDEEKVRRLFQIEATTHFRFRLAHLERLCTIESERDFYLSAACAAGFNIGPDRIDEAIERRRSAYLLDWFRRLFPEFKEPGRALATAQPSTPTAAEQVSHEEEGENEPTEDEPLEVHEKDAIVVPCPACEADNMLLLRLSAEVTSLPRDPSGTRATSTPDTVVRCQYKCSGCPEEFYVFVEPMGGRSYAAETSLSPKFREPKTLVQALDLRVDRKEDAWQVIVGGRIAGSVAQRPRTEAGG